MTVGILQVEIQLPGTHSLKDKRSIIKHIKNQSRKKFNVSISETGLMDNFRRSLLAIATISSSRDIAHNILEKAENFIELNFGVIITDVKMELL